MSRNGRETSGSDAADDLAMMRRVSDGDEQAIGELYDRFGSLVYRMAYQSMPTRAEADDAVQEVFVRLWRTAGKFDPKRASLVTWVMMLTRRHLVDRLRRRQARIQAGTLEESWAGASETRSPTADMEQDERLAGLLDKIEKLPELQRTVVTRAYLRGQTLKQIGVELDVPLGTVKSALSRALARLRERVSNQEAA